MFHISGANGFSILMEQIYASPFAENTFIVPNEQGSSAEGHKQMSPSISLYLSEQHQVVFLFNFRKKEGLYLGEGVGGAKGSNCNFGVFS